MSVIPGTVVGGQIVPSDTADTYPVTNPLYGLGGMRTVATTTARNAIPVARLEHLCLVAVRADGNTYRLKNTWAGGPTIDSDWEIAIGSAGAVSLIGNVNSIPFVDSSDITLLKTSTAFTRHPVTEIVRTNVGYTAATNYLFNVFVDPSGNDGNLGYDPTSPWLTISHAISQAILVGGGKYIINVADGTYPATSFDVPDCISREMEDIGLETMIEIVGNETLPGNVKFSNTGSSSIVYQNSNKTVLFVRGVEFSGGGSNTAIQQSAGKIYLRNCNFDNFGRVANSYRDSLIYTFTGANGINITNCFTGFVGDSSLTFFNNSNITITQPSATNPCNLFMLYNSTFVNGSGATITMNGFAITGSGYMFTARNSYINLGIFSSYVGHTIDSPFDVDGATYVDVGHNNSITFTAPNYIARIKGKSYINDAGNNVWNFSSVPAAGIELSGGGQFASKAILRSGILFLDDIVKYITYPADQAQTRYSYDNRYTEKIGFRLLGKIPQGFSGVEIGPMGTSNVTQVLYVAESKCVITKLYIKTRIATGVLLADDYTIYVNGVASSMVASMVNSNTATSVVEVHLVAGDQISLRFSSSIFTLAEDLFVQMVIRILE